MHPLSRGQRTGDAGGAGAEPEACVCRAAGAGPRQRASQVQDGPQAQASPHSQMTRRGAAPLWQPQVQVAPGQEVQVQVVFVVSADMVISSCWGEPPC